MVSHARIAEDDWGWFVDPAAEKIGRPMRLPIVTRNRTRRPNYSFATTATISTTSIIVAATTQTIMFIAVGTVMYYMS